MPTVSFATAFDLRGRVVLVTGGASGIGRAIAEAYAERGARLALFDRDPAVTATAASLPGHGHLATAVDVTDAAALAAAVDRVHAQAGRIDVLVNNAGIVRLAPAEDATLEDWQATLSVNLTAPFMVAQLVGRIMLAQGAGRIVNLASQAAVVGLQNHIAYCTSKAGILGLTRVLALEWGPRGINVNAISPTVVETDLGRKAWAGAVGEAMKQLIPTRRFAQPEEIALAALFLGSDAAGMINGENMVIDGGYTIA